MQEILIQKLVDVSGIKSFVDVVIARDEREGARQLILSCGLGGMRPNVVVMGFPSELQHPARASIRCPRPSASASHKSDESEITIKGVVDEAPKKHRVIDVNSLPTDSARRETPIRPTTYVGECLPCVSAPEPAQLVADGRWSDFFHVQASWKIP